MPKKKSHSQPTDEMLPAKYLKQIANCLAYLAIHTGELRDKSKGDLMQVLAGFGFDRAAIASLLDTTPESVSARLSQLKAE